MSRVGSAVQTFEKLLEGLYEKPEDYPNSITFLPLETAKEILTPAKLEVVRSLKEKDVDSLSNLAKELDRPLSSLSVDCKELEDQGLIQLEKEANKKRPSLGKDHLVVLY